MKKKLIRTVIIILAVIVCLPVILFGAPMVYNNFILLSIKNDLKDAVKATDGVEILEIDTVCGNLNGNGNKMQFIAAAIVSAPDEASVRDCLAKAGNYTKEYFRLRGEDIEIRHLEHEKLDLNVTSYGYEDSVYLIYVFSQPSHASVFDVRGH